MKLLVSILIPAYNAEERVGETILSSLAKTCGRKEIIVVDDGSKDRTAVAQAVGVVGGFVSGDNLVEALPQQGQRIMLHAVVLPRIAEKLGQIAGQMMTLIESPQGQKTGIAGDLTSGKIGMDGLVAMEGEGQSW